jgi:glycosyltransferase involved in cell wall biosynthesis
MNPAWPHRVLILAPQVWSSDGGVQRYSRYICSAFSSIRPSCHVELNVLLDRPAGPFRRLRFIAASLSAIFRPFRRPELVIATHLHMAPLAWLVARLSGACFWVSLHGIEAWNLGPGLRWLSLLNADLLLPVSIFTADKLQQHFSRKLRMSMLPNTYDAQRFKPGPRSSALLKRYKLSAHQPLVFCLTRLSRSDHAKHVDRLILSMVQIRRSVPQAHLLIGGDGDDRPRLQALVSKNGLDDVVSLPGRISDDELPDHYRLASVFALPSSKEGFGIVFLEALGCGLPVLAGNRDGSVEPLAHGRFGLLVDPDQPLAPALSSLLLRHGDLLWFDSVRLSNEVEAAFGFSAFCSRLHSVLLSQDR